MSDTPHASRRKLELVWWAVLASTSFVLMTAVAVFWLGGARTPPAPGAAPESSAKP